MKKVIKSPSPSLTSHTISSYFLSLHGTHLYPEAFPTYDNKLNSHRYAGANCAFPSNSLPIIWAIHNGSGVHSHNISADGQCREDGRGLCGALAIPTPLEKKESPAPYRLFGNTPVCFWPFYPLLLHSISFNISFFVTNIKIICYLN